MAKCAHKNRGFLINEITNYPHPMIERCLKCNAITNLPELRGAEVVRWEQ